LILKLKLALKLDIDWVEQKAVVNVKVMPFFSYVVMTATEGDLCTVIISQQFVPGLIPLSLMTEQHEHLTLT